MHHEASTAILGREKKLAIHFPEIQFLPSETRHVKAAVHGFFLGRHLVIEPTAPRDNPFLLYDIRVGRNSQIAATG
jgi:hypothetical protein